MREPAQVPGEPASTPCEQSEHCDLYGRQAGPERAGSAPVVGAALEHVRREDCLGVERGEIERRRNGAPEQPGSHAGGREA